MQFIENILLLQCLKKETATAKEHDLRPLGKVIIFRDRQADRQNLPIIYRYGSENQLAVLRKCNQDGFDIKFWLGTIQP